MPTVVPTVRSAQTKDRSAIVALVQAAFGGPGHDAGEEVAVVTATWARRGALPGLELVAADGDAVVGYALGARGDVGGGAVVTVAPLAVAPGRQRQGVGTLLMSELLSRADRQGWPAAVLLGDPGYYRRFGFEPAAGAGLWYGPVGPDDVHFLVRRLSAYDPGLRGRVRYCWEGPGPGYDLGGDDPELSDLGSMRPAPTDPPRSGLRNL